jgi:transglutaminase-like putative cysteine protease
MSQLATLGDQRRASIAAVERYFQISLYLLVCTGFATLVTTGKLDILSVLGVTVALLIRGWLLLRHENIKIPERWTSYLTIAYVPIYVLDFLFISQSFVSATVHMVLFIMVAKIFSVQRDRDYLYLATLAFMEVLAAAILTVDSVFLAAFCVFMILAVSTFVSMEMRRSAAKAAHAAHLPALRVSSGGGGSGAAIRVFGRLRQLNGALSATSIVLMLMIFAGTAVIFFMLPRISAGYLGNFAPRNELVSGFTNQVDLGQIGIIQQSNQVVMHVTLQEGRADVMSLKWRGVALDSFDGKVWSTRGSLAYGVPRSFDGGLHLTRALAASNQDTGEVEVLTRRQPLRYRVLMEPVAISVFFVAPTAEVLFGNYRWVALDNNGTIYDNDRDRQITAYEVISNVAQPSPDQLRRASSQYPESVEKRFLQLPPLDPRVAPLARQVTASASTPYDKARALERYLGTQFGYTLQLPSPVPDDPIAFFLFTRKQGHCEYFASAMAVMLRSIGIPARIVNGFRTGEYNDVTGSYIIRARDAHSWVEAYFPGAGWMSFDPTPAAVAPSPGGWNRMLLYIDAAREFWREWVINYDFSHQRTLGNTATSRARRFVDDSRRWLRTRYDEAIDRAQRIRDQAAREPAKWGGRAVLGFSVLLLLVLARPLWRAWKRRRLMLHPASAPSTAAGLWYARMTRTLAHRGWRKRASQSPQEFLRTIDDPAIRRGVESFTDTYERARFGGSATEAEKLPEKFRELVDTK